MRTKLVIITVLGLLLSGVIAAPTFAQSAGVVTAEVDRPNLSTDEVLTLTVSVNTMAGNASQPTLPAMDGFDIIGSSSSTQISMINGGMSMHQVYYYQMRPTWAGNLVIEPITVTMNGGHYSTDPIAVTVTQGTGQLRPPPSGSGSGFGSLPGFPSMPNFPNLGSLPGFGSLPTNPADPSLPAEPSDTPTELAGQDYFVEAEVDIDAPYQGQQVVYTFRFYQAVDIFDVLTQPEYQGPAFTGFWHDKQPQQGEYTVQGADRTYRVIQMQTVLFPTVIGPVTIDSAILTIPGGFFSRGQALKTQPLTVDVQPLPAGAPADFQGAVGQFDIQAQTDTMATKVNDTVTLRVTVNGQGNIDALSDLAWPESPEWRGFDSQAETDSRLENGRWVGSRVYNRVLVPTVSGNLTLPAIPFSYFDPETGTYHTVSTQPITIAVAPDGGAAPTLPVADTGAANLAPEFSGLRSIKPAPASWNVGNPPLTQQAAYWLLWVLPAALVVGHFGWRLRNKRLNGDPALRRRQKAASRAHKSLRAARKNPAEAHSAAGRILTDYIAAKSNQSVAGMTHSELADLLLARGVDPSLAEWVQSCLILSEMGRYAPTGTGAGSEYASSGDILTETGRLIEELEKAL